MNARNAIAGIGAIIVSLGCASARADEGGIAIEDRGEQVRIVARGARLAQGARPAPRGAWIDVALADAARATTRLPALPDRTIKRADVVLGEQPRLSVLLHHDMNAADYAKAARVEQSDDGVVLRLTRDVDSLPGTAPSRSGTAAVKAVPGARSGAAARPLSPAAPAVAHIAALARAPAPMPAPDATSAAPAAPVATATAAAPARQPVVVLPAATEKPAAAEPRAAATPEPLALADDRPLLLAGAAATEPSRTPLYAMMLLLSGAGVIALLVARRRRRQGTAPAQLLRVLSTCQLSPRVKVMLVAVGDREMLLSVGDSGARVLGRWHAGGPDEGGGDPTSDDDSFDGHDGRGSGSTRPSEPSSSGSGSGLGLGFGAGAGPGRPHAQARDAELPEIHVELPPLYAASGKLQSPAVAGLLKLRREGAAEAPAATPLADEQWARELLSALRVPATSSNEGLVR